MLDGELLLEGVERGCEVNADANELRVQGLEVGQPGIQPGDFLRSGAVERADERVHDDRTLAQ